MDNIPIGRVYRMKWWFRAFSTVFLLIAFIFLVDLGRDILSDHATLDTWKAVAAAVLLLVGLGLTAQAFSSMIRLSGDSIEVVSVFRRRSMLLAGIRGRREYVVRGGEEGDTRYLRLESTDGSSPLDIGKNLYTFDSAFWEWFNQFPDLDSRDTEKHKDSNFGLV
jgi:hypothetical protein